VHAEAGEAADVKAKSNCGTMAACSASIIVRRECHFKNFVSNCSGAIIRISSAHQLPDLMVLLL